MERRTGARGFLAGLARPFRRKALGPASDVSAWSGGWLRVLEPFAGAWQRNVEWRLETALGYAPVYACVSLVAADIGKLRITLIESDGDGIWAEAENAAYSPVLRKPNHYQTRIAFLESWMLSKLIHGNTYILKERDGTGLVRALYVLDPTRVKPLVASDGSVFYDVASDNLSGLSEPNLRVPASEIIHDVAIAPYHPLCGVSPLTACGLAAVQGLKIQAQSTRFFENDSRPGGLLSMPGSITNEEAKRWRAVWEEQQTGINHGRIAVIGNGAKYETFGVNPVDAQLIQQLAWTAETVCTAYHVPAWMIGVGPMPAVANIESLTLQYYAQCLQSLIEKVEVLLDEALDLSSTLGIELDLTNLLRMDTPTRVKAGGEAVLTAQLSPNEARRIYHGLGPVAGGDSPYLQQQNYSLLALSKRDAMADPFHPSAPAPAPAFATKALDAATVSAAFSRALGLEAA